MLQDKNRRFVWTGIGCAATAPATIIGLAALTDYAGPNGWAGFAEILGWIAICAIASHIVSNSLNTFGSTVKSGAIRLVIAAVCISAFTIVTNLIASGASLADRVSFTTSLEIIGNLSVLVAVLIAIKAVRKQR